MESTTTTAPPDGDAPPPLNPVPADEDDLDEYARIYGEQLAYQTWLVAHPTSDRDTIARVFHPDGPGFDRFREQMSDMIERGTVIEDDLAVEIFSPLSAAGPSDGVLRAAVVAKRTHLRVVDSATGESDVDRTGDETYQLLVDLRSTADGRWLIWTQDEEQ